MNVLEYIGAGFVAMFAIALIFPVHAVSALALAGVLGAALSNAIKWRRNK